MNLLVNLKSNKMEKNKSIEVLNTVLEINNDRIAGYETAIKEAEDADLKAQFMQFIQTSMKCKTELTSAIISLGGTPTEGTKATGKIFRVWMDFKAALTGKDRKGILKSCEFGEDAALDTYESALKDNVNDIRLDYQNMLRNQLTMISADHNKVKKLRDMLVTQD